jgi:RNA polymerase sigma factor (sigma-70 family)
MSQAQIGTLLRHLHTVVRSEGVKDLSDTQLLQRFSAVRDEAAFAHLVHRHSGLVWGVCQRVLRHQQDAEDAYQATFLILARQAASIRRAETVGGWLYRVAYRVALRADANRSRRRHHETQAANRTHECLSSELAWRELQDVLDAEVQRLPEKYRSPFVLCCLEGQSKADAARHLEGLVPGLKCNVTTEEADGIVGVLVKDLPVRSDETRDVGDVKMQMKE